MTAPRWSDDETDDVKKKFLSDSEDEIFVKDHSKTSKSRTEKQLWAVLAMCLLVIVALVVVIIVTHIKVDQVYKQCQTPQCIKSAGEIISMMDLDADPCKDFYQYACGGWEKNALPPPSKPKWNAFSKLYKDNSAALNKLINEMSPPCSYKGKNSTAICKAKDYYSACMNTKAIEKRGNEQALKYIKDLGSWPLGTNPKAGRWDETKWNFINTLVEMNGYNLNLLFGYGIGGDDKNSSRNIIQFGQAGLTLGDPRQYNNSDTEKYHTAYTEFLTQLLVLLGERNDNATEKAIEEIWLFEKQLASIFVPPEKLQDAEKNYHKMTVADLTNLMEKTIDISSYLSKVFKTDIPDSEEILVSTPTYFKALAQVLRTVDKKILANYMMSHAIYGILSYLSQDFLEATLVLKSVTKGVSSLPPRWETCVSRIDDVFGFATGALYVQEKFSETSKKEADEIVEHVRNAFIVDLPDVEWMDDETRKVAAEKAKAVHKMIGYPDWLMDPVKLDDHYKKLTATSDDQFTNGLRAKKFFNQKELDKRGKAPDSTEWHMMPSTVNAYYNAGYNEIVFPAGILQRPFYGPDYPVSHHFGSMGTVVGHELTHGFDNRGSEYDKTGNLRTWWTEKSKKGFEERKTCMINQYNKYLFKGNKVNGLTTLGENIADNGGIKSAFKAFQKYSMMHKNNKLSLPGLNMTDSQLFFVGFSQIWCAYYTPEYAKTSILTDPHSPARVRVQGVLSNNPNFAEAYQCKLGSPMNPKEKCSVW